MGIFGDSPSKLFKQGDKLREGGKFKEAIEKYEQALEMEKKNLRLKAMVCLNIGSCSAKLSENEKSLEYSEKAIDFVKKERDLFLPSDEEKPKDYVYGVLLADLTAIQALYNKAVVLSAMNKPEQARNVLDDLINNLQPQTLDREFQFRQERLNTIAKIVSGKGGVDVPAEDVKKKYKELGYSDKQIELDMNVGE